MQPYLFCRIYSISHMLSNIFYISLWHFFGTGQSITFHHLLSSNMAFMPDSIVYTCDHGGSSSERNLLTLRCIGHIYFQFILST